jgi:hypothetical protein
MSYIKRSIFIFFDILFTFIGFPAALILFAYRRFGSMRLPFATAMLRRVGVFPIRRHYYEPLFDKRDLRLPLSDERNLPGIDMNVDGQLSLLCRLNREDELVSMQWSSDPLRTEGFALGNGSFESGDADFLYQFVREIKPPRIIEIGSGHSTKVAQLALARNRAETGMTTSHICVEPFEMPWLEKLVDVTVRRERVETCSIEWSRDLQTGDLLFIDSSHMIRPQGDVLAEYLEILPTLSSGVFVHVHDIFTPRDYLSEWIDTDVKFWNEQYLLEALLSNSHRYKIVAALNFLSNNHSQEMKRVCPYLTDGRQPGSFYFVVN